MSQILVNGFISGLVIALLGLAFTIASLPTRVFHVALAGIYTIAPFVTWSVWSADWHPAWGIVLALSVAVLLSDHWRFLARSFEGTYPNWKAMLPAASAYKARVSLDPEAVLQVMQAAQQLPTPDERHQTIGVELANDSLRILGKSQPALPWTKIEIRASEVAGPDMTLLLDRRLLLKALRFGLSRFEFIDEVSPVRFSADGRQMVVMPLRPNATTSAARQPSPRPVAPATAEADPSPPPMAEPPQNPTMPNHKHDTAAQASRQVNGTSPPPSRAPRTGEESKPSLDHALVQIESIKAGFREAITGLSKLGDIIRATLREQRTTDKDLQNLRQTLRSLQAVRI